MENANLLSVSDFTPQHRLEFSFRNSSVWITEDIQENVKNQIFERFEYIE